MESPEFRSCLTGIAERLDRYDEANRHQVWAFSRRFHERIVLMSTISYVLRQSLNYAQKGSREYEAAVRNLENVTALHDDYVAIADQGPYVRGRKRPRMVENNNRWFELVASLKAFVNTYSR